MHGISVLSIDTWGLFSLKNFPSGGHKKKSGAFSASSCPPISQIAESRARELWGVWRGGGGGLASAFEQATPLGHATVAHGFVCIWRPGACWMGVTAVKTATVGRTIAEICHSAELFLRFL